MYRYIKSIIQKVYQQYGILPHFIDIYHSDGRWDFPDEIPKLINHPYLHGYGKLLHSGYHFIDLLCYLTDEFKYDSYRVVSYANSVQDFKAQVPDKFYEDTFGIVNEYDYGQQDVGEIDSYSLVQLQSAGRNLTTASINLLHTGFSRRAWCRAKPDLYKGNGRLRHERINIQIGPLMNIQVHSYQSTECHDVNQPPSTGIGGLEHFDIHIYRNTDLIGGLPFEIVTLRDLEKRMEMHTDVGQNEYARHQLLADFLEGAPTGSEIRSHLRTNKILASIADSMYKNKEVRGELSYERDDEASDYCR